MTWPQCCLFEEWCDGCVVVCVRNNMMTVLLFVCWMTWLQCCCLLLNDMTTGLLFVCWTTWPQCCYLFVEWQDHSVVVCLLSDMTSVVCCLNDVTTVLMFVCLQELQCWADCILPPITLPSERHRALGASIDSSVFSGGARWGKSC